MTRKSKWLGLSVLIVSLLLAGCNKTSNGSDLETQLKEEAEKIENLVTENTELIKLKDKLQDEVEEIKEKLAIGPVEPEPPAPQQLGPSSNVLATSLQVIELIKDKNMDDLAQYIHSSQGLRLSPYFYIDTQNDQVFTAQEVATLDQNTAVFTWGNYDGSGEAIDLNFNDYYDEFIYNQDFMNPHLIGNNTPIGSGNMIDNIDQAYPNGHFIEFHFTGFDAQYAGIDWNSLRLVFEEENGLWYLVGIVHGQWTI
ncbi:MAG TPA: hypothetical protein GX707_09735 [Epulopiscium sp.]|nr:hypothetical protein [Candidatus Epulonipiscium sp.]